MKRKFCVKVLLSAFLLGTTWDIKCVAYSFGGEYVLIAALYLSDE